MGCIREIELHLLERCLDLPYRGPERVGAHLELELVLLQVVQVGFAQNHQSRKPLVLGGQVPYLGAVIRLLRIGFCYGSVQRCLACEGSLGCGEIIQEGGNRPAVFLEQALYLIDLGHDGLVRIVDGLTEDLGIE